MELTEASGQQHYKQTYYQVEITSHDGTPLRATVYQPALPLNQTAPLIIHAHGFGAFRVSDPYSLYAKIAYTGEAALKAWKSGYWMISYDQRGFGSSGGKISMMDPKKEVKDVSSIIDWAINNIPNLKKDSGTNDKDYSIGMTGESYGGGAQLLASVMDERIDAIIPVTTWYDFTMAINKGATKTLWPAVLYYGGELGSAFDINEETAIAFSSALSNEITDDVIQQWQERSLSYYCDQQRYPQADALLIQAFSDSILSVNHALKAMECFEKGGKDAHAILIQDGHNIPIVDGYTRFPFFSIDESIHCGTQEFDLINTALSWWDEKLKGIPNTEHTLSKYCVSLDYDNGIALTTIEPDYKTFTFKEQEVASGLSGLTEIFMQPIDNFVDLFRFTDNEHFEISPLENQPTGGTLRPLFIPFKQVTQQRIVFGTPKAKLSVSYDEDKSIPLLYVGLGKRKAGKSSIELVNRQVSSLTGNNVNDIELAAISTRLEKGDTLGLLVYGYHAHYMFRSPFWPTTARIEGSIAVPFFEQQP
ncbi:hypothetical protein A9Q81_05895 [Gammaproteobacteria bacterium 42_54_T18]|nr:hypothetical protein A9Q81_05895 [Gammaproteobacteria bacterium 42_54_T18]